MIERKICDYLSEEERNRLLASLHHALVWVGVKEPEQLLVDGSELRQEMEKHRQRMEDLPDEFHVEEGRVELHRLIWRLINEDEITEQERTQISELIEILDKKERLDEEYLRSRSLNCQEALKIHDDAAELIRSLLDLRDLLKKRHHPSGSEDEDKAERLIKQKLDDAKRWKGFLDEMKKGPEAGSG